MPRPALRLQHPAPAATAAGQGARRSVNAVARLLVSPFPVVRPGVVPFLLGDGMRIVGALLVAIRLRRRTLGPI